MVTLTFSSSVGGESATKPESSVSSLLPLVASSRGDVGFDYTSEYDACNWGEVVLNISMVDIYKEIVPQLERTWM